MKLQVQPRVGAVFLLAASSSFSTFDTNNGVVTLLYNSFRLLLLTKISIHAFATMSGKGKGKAPMERKQMDDGVQERENGEQTASNEHVFSATRPAVRNPAYENRHGQRAYAQIYQQPTLARRPQVRNLAYEDRLEEEAYVQKKHPVYRNSSDPIGSPGPSRAYARSSSEDERAHERRKSEMTANVEEATNLRLARDSTMRHLQTAESLSQRQNKLERSAATCRDTQIHHTASLSHGQRNEEVKNTGPSGNWGEVRTVYTRHQTDWAAAQEPHLAGPSPLQSVPVLSLSATASRTRRGDRPPSDPNASGSTLVRTPTQPLPAAHSRFLEHLPRFDLDSEERSEPFPRSNPSFHVDSEETLATPANMPEVARRIPKREAQQEQTERVERIQMEPKQPEQVGTSESSEGNDSVAAGILSTCSPLVHVYITDR